MLSPMLRRMAGARHRARTTAALLVSLLTLVASPLAAQRPSTPGAGPGAPESTIAPSFTQQPRDVVTAAFVDARFSVGYNGRPEPQVSWQFSADGSNWNDVPGAHDDVLVVHSPVIAHSGTLWRARLLAHGREPLFSRAARLTVNRAEPEIQIDAPPVRYDGTPKSVSVTTHPAGLWLEVSYWRDGVKVVAPVDPGSYAVSVEARGPNHAGTATSTLVIEP